jgi:hypothetical protein
MKNKGTVGRHFVNLLLLVATSNGMSFRVGSGRSKAVSDQH